MKKIYTNPGHSDRDPGAVGYEQERRLNVAVTKYMNEYLLANYECEVKSNPGTLSDLSKVCAEANAWGADLFVSNHFNAGKGDGYECFVYSEARVPLGKLFEKQILAIGQNSRGVKVKPAFIVLNSTNMPAVLNEGAFVDNKKDIEDWNDEAELKAMGIAYAKAAAEYLKLEKKSTEKVEEDYYTMKMRHMSKGHKGEDVKALQILLNGRGYNCGTPDGIFGSKTDSAVRKYQKAKKLTVDGIAGPATMSALMGV